MKKGRVLFSLAMLLIIITLIPFPVFALSTEKSGTTGTCRWSFDESTGTLYVQGDGTDSGVMEDYTYYGQAKKNNGHDNEVPWTSFRSEIKRISIDSSVKHIGTGCFCWMGYPDAVSVSLPKGVDIGKEAFWGAAITDINLSANLDVIGENAFYYAELPEEILISAKEIGNGAFAYTNIKKVSTDNRLQSIGEGAFQNCGSLRRVKLNEAGLTSIGAYAFAGLHFEKYVYGIYVPKCVKEIGAKAFGYTTDYKKDGSFVMFTEEGSVADAYAKDNEIDVKYGKFFSNYKDAYWVLNESTRTLYLYGCWVEDTGNDEKVTIPDATDEYWNSFVDEYKNDVDHLVIGVENNYYCKLVEIDPGINRLSNLLTVEIDPYVTGIGENAFQGLEKLYCVTSLEHIRQIGADAFQGCSALDNINFGPDIEKIGDEAFSDCTTLKSLTLGVGESQNVSEIQLGHDVFRGCSTLQSVELGDRITTCTDGMFSDCTSLSHISYTDQLTTIGENAFKNCQSLSKFVFGKGLVSIGAYAFLGTEINEVFIPEEITEIGTGAFCYYENKNEKHLKEEAMLYVVDGSVGKNYAESNSIPYEINAGGSIGNGIWRYNMTTNALYILGEGEMEEYTVSKNAPWMMYEYQIKSVLIGDGITAISRKAFAGKYKRLESVTIADSVATIGYQAFYNCPLKVVEIPEGVNNIGKEAFGYLEDEYGNVNKNEELILKVSQHSAAEEYAIANGLNLYIHGTTGDCQWSYDRIKQQLILEGNGKMASYDEFTDVPWFSFQNEIRTVIVGDGVKTIGKNAFCNCENLTGVNLGSGVREIEARAFSNTALILMYLPESVEVIADGAIAFEYLYPLDQERKEGLLNRDFVIVTPNENTAGAKYCRDLNLNIEYAKEGMAGDCFWKLNTATGELEITGEGTFISENYGWDGSEVKSVVIAYGITEIPDEAFQNCTEMESVSIADSVTSIGARAFENCYGLEGVKLPSGLTSIGMGAFLNCNMQTITVPASVTSIGEYALGYSWGSGVYYLTFSENEFVVCGEPGSVAQRYTNENEGILFEEYVPDTENDKEDETENAGGVQPVPDETEEDHEVVPDKTEEDHEVVPDKTEEDHEVVPGETTENHEPATAGTMEPEPATDETTEHHESATVGTMEPESAPDGTTILKTTDHQEQTTGTIQPSAEGSYSGTIEKSFRINPEAVKILKVEPKKKAITIKWKKNTVQTTGYQIQYSLKKNFKKAKVKTVKKNKTTSLTIKKLQAKKKYYVRIRSYTVVSGQKYYSSWSNAKKVKTK